MATTPRSDDFERLCLGPCGRRHTLIVCSTGVEQTPNHRQVVSVLVTEAHDGDPGSRCEDRLFAYKEYATTVLHMLR